MFIPFTWPEMTQEEVIKRVPKVFIFASDGVYKDTNDGRYIVIDLYNAKVQMVSGYMMCVKFMKEANEFYQGFAREMYVKDLVYEKKFFQMVSWAR